MQIANAVRKALEADTRTMREIARASGVHWVNLSQFRAGKRTLGLESLVPLAEAVGVEITVVPKKKRRV